MAKSCIIHSVIWYGERVITRALIKKNMSEPSRKSPELSEGSDAGLEPKRPLTPEAKRALAEAEARRQAQSATDPERDSDQTKEVGGRKGPDPVRFGDWENGGIASDF